MKVTWTPEALQDRLDIWEYIAADNPAAAVHMDELFMRPPLLTFRKEGDWERLSAPAS